MFRFMRATTGKILPNDIKAQCTTSMSKLFHSCDTQSGWKHGGAYTFSEGKDNNRVDVYTYFMDPKHVRPDPPPARLPSSCDVYYKFLYDEFFVSGGLWAGDDEGMSRFRSNIRRCGAVTAWKFKYKTEPDSNGFEWDAYGTLPIGRQWNCVRQAIVDSGGAPDVVCG